MRHEIVFLDRGTLGATLRTPRFEHGYVEHEATAPEQTIERLRHATIAITNKAPLRAESLAALPSLRLIAVAATGTDIVDKVAARERGIGVVNIRDYAYNTVPEHVLALMFALRRSLMRYVTDVRAGAWQRASQFCFLDHPIHDVAGSTLGIVGYGAIGRALGRRAQALDMRVLASDPASGAPDLVDLATLLRESDVVSLHAPLLPETRDMIGAAELRTMKRSAILINTARGGLVDEAALAAALRAGELGGAGFDVLVQEPPREGSPLLDTTVPNLLVTPHVAWASSEAQQILAAQLLDNIDAFVAGEPRNLVV